MRSEGGRKDELELKLTSPSPSFRLPLSILDQMRLESQRGNWVRVRVGGRKINRGYLKEEGNSVRPLISSSRSSSSPPRADLASFPSDLSFHQDLKLRYYDLIIALALEEDAFLDACKSYQEVYDTEEVKKDEARAQQVRLHSLLPSLTHELEADLSSSVRLV